MLWYSDDDDIDYNDNDGGNNFDFNADKYDGLWGIKMMRRMIWWWK